MEIIKRKGVPVLITCDIDPLTRDERIRYGIPLSEEQPSLLRTSIELMIDLLSDIGINATFFVTAALCEEIEDELSELKRRGHQIGCHGLTHDEYDNYARLPYNEQFRRIRSATEIIEDFVERVTVFRAPAVRISAKTLKILEKLGYLADSSVSSQRFDLVSSNINPKLLIAPRRPYHPKENDAYRRGDMKIMEIPISAFILPFISGTLSIFGLRFMKYFFKMLYMESLRTGKPIVYLMHPAEFLASENHRIPLSWFFSYRMWRFQGNPIRYLLFRKSGKSLLEEHMELFAHIKYHYNVKFLSVDGYISRYNGNVEII